MLILNLALIRILPLQDPMILSARAAGAIAAARLMHPGATPPSAAPYAALAQQQVPPQSPYHQQQHQLAGLLPGPQQHRPAGSAGGLYPATGADPSQQGPYNVDVTPQVWIVLR